MLQSKNQTNIIKIEFASHTSALLGKGIKFKATEVLRIYLSYSYYCTNHI